ncbi:hypothetical protein [Planosporangium mesophilum]|uniref:hypothetical protein n=1 Tax=Planosporangium mesophilum TaxID=689768 RepID=UPI001438B2F3|nr:hypothetical protein [Planosporangium mesophilum]NJC86202.1 hypothetical protein [Planosporangium mesophilum]
MDVDKLTTELAAYEYARLWDVTDPRSVAEWVFSSPDDFEDFEALPAAAAALDQMRAAFRSESDDDRFEATALAFAGTAIRLTVPVAARTGGERWALTGNDGTVDKWLRLTVGDTEALIVAWGPGRFFLQLRLASSPMKAALKSGSLSEDDLVIFKGTDLLRSFARDAVRYYIDDVENAKWFVDQPAVVQAARLMNARLAAAAARLPRTSRHDPELAARAWAAAEVLYFDSDVELPTLPDEDLLDAEPTGFDRPYRGKPAEGDYPEVQPTSPAARERANAEHDALCRQLIAHLSKRGIEAGELTSPPVDVAWRGANNRQVIAEIKSCFDGNDTDQLRLGLGQLLEYRQRLAGAGVTADAILLVTRVKDPFWYEICRSVDIRLLAGDDEATWDLG